MSVGQIKSINGDEIRFTYLNNPDHHDARFIYIIEGNFIINPNELVADGGREYNFGLFKMGTEEEYHFRATWDATNNMVNNRFLTRYEPWTGPPLMKKYAKFGDMFGARSDTLTLYRAF